MINNWYTFEKLTQVLSDQVRDHVFDRAFSYKKNELILHNANPDRPSLQITFGPPFHFIFLKPFHIPKRHIRIFPDLENEILESCVMQGEDRDMILRFRSGNRLILSFRSGAGNVFYLRRDGRSVQFRKGRSLDESWTETAAVNHSNISEDARFNRFWTANIHEVFGCDNDEGLYDQINRSNGQPWQNRFILKADKDTQFDPDTFYENYHRFIITTLNSGDMEEKRKRLSQELQRKDSYLSRNLARMGNADDLQRKSALYRFMADTLNGLRHSLTEGMKDIAVPDYLQQPGMPEIIHLDEGRSLNENIDGFYRKSADLLQRIKMNELRIPELRSSLAEVQAAQEALKLCSNNADMDTFRKTWSSLLTAVPDEKSTDSGEGRPYREFLSPSGFRIWVGKSARQNDEMTFHLAHKKDLWLHARHSRGSHVLIRCAGAAVDRKDLNFAARLAARFSEEKHSGLVSVVCTERRYVSKIRGAAPGKVRYQYEKDILISPEES